MLRRLPPDLLAVVLCVLLHCALFESGLGGSDGWGYFANVESLVEDRDLDLANNLAPRGRDGVLGEVGTADGRLGGVPHPTIPGRVVNSYPLGKALADLPGYLLGKVAGASLMGLLGQDSAGFPSMAGTPYEGIPPRRMFCALGMVLGSNLYAAAAAAMAFLALVRAGFARPTAATATLLAFFGSPLPYYAVNAMSHAAATALASGMLLLWVSGPPTRGRCLALGVLVSASTSLRYASVGLVPLLGALLLLRRGSLLGFAAGLPSFAWIEMARNWREYGSPLRTAYPTFAETFKDVWHPVPFLNLYLAEYHGILRWSPLVAFAVWGLVRLAGSAFRREAAWTALALSVGHAVLPGLGGSYHAGSGFSQRYLCESMPCWALGIAALLEGAGRFRAAAFAALAGWNTLLFLLTQGRMCHVSPFTGTREGATLADYLAAVEAGPAASARAVLAETVPGRLMGPFWGALVMMGVAATAAALMKKAMRQPRRAGDA